MNNYISDVSPLKNLTQLTGLYLFDNHVSDVSPLKNLTQLTRLYLDDNYISDVSPLKNLTQLTELGLSENWIADVSPLAENRGLDQGDIIRLQGNRLDEAAIRTHIPTLQERGVRIDL